MQCVTEDTSLKPASTSQAYRGNGTQKAYFLQHKVGEI